MKYKNRIDEMLNGVLFDDAAEHISILTHAGELVRSTRKQHRISQKELSRISGVPQSNISLLECGKYNISLLQLEKILNALNSHIHMEVVKDE